MVESSLGPCIGNPGPVVNTFDTSCRLVVCPATMLSVPVLVPVVLAGVHLVFANSASAEGSPQVTVSIAVCNETGVDLRGLLVGNGSPASLSRSLGLGSSSGNFGPVGDAVCRCCLSAINFSVTVPFPVISARVHLVGAGPVSAECFLQIGVRVAVLDVALVADGV